MLGPPPAFNRSIGHLASTFWYRSYWIFVDIPGYSMWQGIWLLLIYCFLRAKSAGLLCPWNILIHDWVQSQSLCHPKFTNQPILGWFLHWPSNFPSSDSMMHTDSAERQQQVWFLHYRSHSDILTGYAMRAPCGMIINTDWLTNCKPRLYYVVLYILASSRQRNGVYCFWLIFSPIGSCLQNSPNVNAKW